VNNSAIPEAINKKFDKDHASVTSPITLKFKTIANISIRHKAADR